MRRIEIPTRFVDKAKFVRIIFTNVEREYDALLHLMTLGFDWTWRRRMLSRIDFSSELRILDLACGTGLVTFDLCRRVESRGLVIGLDLSSDMLRIASQKKLRSKSSIEFVRAVGEFLPFRDETFSYATVGLALRNFGDKSAMFREALRVLSSFGWFFSVDFVRPDNSLIRKFYMFHIFWVLPALGRLVSPSWFRTLTYLANSIRLSTSTGEVCAMLRENGFHRILLERITLGIVTLLGGQK